MRPVLTGLMYLGRYDAFLLLLFLSQSLAAINLLNNMNAAATSFFAHIRYFCFFFYDVLPGKICFVINISILSGALKMPS